MTNAIFLSDLSETFLSDSSNFLKNKMTLHGFFFSSGYEDMENFWFFEFLTVWTYFSSEFFENCWEDSVETSGEEIRYTIEREIREIIIVRLISQFSTCDWNRYI